MPYRDLSRIEQQNVLDTMRALRARFGNWLTVERALPISHSQRVEMTEGRTEVSTTIAFRIAKLLEVSLHDVIQGIALPKPTFPQCGHVGLGSARPWITSWSDTSRSLAIRNAIVVLTSVRPSVISTR